MNEKEAKITIHSQSNLSLAKAREYIKSNYAPGLFDEVAKILYLDWEDHYKSSILIIVREEWGYEDPEEDRFTYKIYTILDDAVKNGWDNINSKYIIKFIIPKRIAEKLYKILESDLK